MSAGDVRVRYRLRLARRGPARFLSHLDGLRALHRALRRSGLPVAQSRGFNPHLKVAFASALALGLESEAEFVDVEMTAPVRLADIAARLGAALPPGFELREVRGAPPGGRALASHKAVSRYLATPPEPDAGLRRTAGGPPGIAGVGAELEAKIERLMDRPKLEVERRPGKTVDLKPMIVALRAESLGEPGGGCCRLMMDLLSGPGGAARADETLSLLGLDAREWSILKTDFWPVIRGVKTSPWQA